MAGGKIRGITIEIGGDTTKLGDALKDTEKQSRDLQTELKAVNTALKFNPENTVLLAQKQELLGLAIAETSEKLGILKHAEQQVVDQFEKGDIGQDQLRAFQREIVTTESKLSGLQTELEQMGSSMGGIETESNGAKNSLDKLTDKIEAQEKELSDLKSEYTNVVLEQGKTSSEAKTLAKEMTDLNTDLKSSKTALSNAEKQADKLATALKDSGDEAKDSEGGFTVMKGALADLTANAISTAASAIGDFIGSLFDLSEATEEYRVMQAKMAGSASNAGYSAEFANEKYKQFYSYVGDDQMATNAITNLMGLGTSTENVSNLANGAIGVWASYGDSIPIESLTEAINETVQCGKVTGTFADTINWNAEAQEGLSKALGGNSKAQKTFNKELKNGATVEDAFSAALSTITSEQERAEIVASFLNETYGESKTKYDELAGSVIDANEAELELKETQAKLGETMAPVNTALTNLKNEALIAITPLVQSLADGFMNLYNWLQQNPTVMTVVKAIVIALAAAFGVLATALAIQGLITGVQKAFAFLNTTLLANPIVLVVAAIAGLVAAFIYLWNNCEGFRNFWIGLWEGIKTAASTAWTAITGFFTSAWATITTAWDAAGTYFSTLWANIQLAFNNVVSWFSTLFTNAWTAITTAFTNVGTFFAGLWTSITTAFSAATTWFGTTFTNAWTAVQTAFTNVGTFFTGVWTSITTAFGSVTTWFSTTFTNAWTAIQNVFSGWGTFFSGLWNTISTTFSTLGTSIATAVGDAVASGINGILGWVETTINNCIGLINGAIDVINTIPGVNVGKVATVSIPRLAKGGIVDSPILAQIGEDGREAVLPLENNTGWIREIAEKLSGYQGVGANNATLIAKLDDIYNRLDRMQIVLDTGTLVGETIDRVDRMLGDKQLLSARGV